MSDRAISTVMLPARVDSATAGSVETMLLSALRPNASVIVDGSEVTYMSAAGVRTLATVLHRAEDLHTRVVFCRFSGPAADCLLVSGFSELLDVAESVAAATARLEARGPDGAAERLHPRGAAG
ncbi:MAG: anti-sigma factor antagonist [Reyranella sp.]|nr:MAG: anti-sigma factor antagonist [Reyranella sp.]